MAASQRVAAGTVRWFSGQKGFGFIAPDSGGEDVFVHQTSIQSDGFRTLYEGEAVEFVIDLGEDGRSKATDVIRIGGSRFSGGGRGRSRGRGGGGRRGRFDDGYSGYGGGDYGRGGAKIDGEGHPGRFDDGYGGRGGGRIDGGGGGGGRGACYNCGRTGHLARDCYHNSGGGGGRVYDGDRRGRGGYGSRRGRGGYGGGGGRGEYTNVSASGGILTCYNCGEEGHFARGCPNVKIDNT